MIKYWQSMQNYKHFLSESKVHFDSSERVRLHTELWKPWQKLRLFDTDKAMEFLLPFYSSTGRPAKNQPQILRSFILFFLLCSEGLDGVVNKRGAKWQYNEFGQQRRRKRHFWRSAQQCRASA